MMVCVDALSWFVVCGAFRLGLCLCSFSFIFLPFSQTPNEFYLFPTNSTQPAKQCFQINKGNDYTNAMAIVVPKRLRCQSNHCAMIALATQSFWYNNCHRICVIVAFIDLETLLCRLSWVCWKKIKFIRCLRKGKKDKGKRA